MMENNGLGRLLTCEQAADALGLRVSTIRRMILERRIDTVRPSTRAVRIPETAVNRILERGYTPAIPPGGRASEGNGQDR